MKCFACGFKEPSTEWGKLSISSHTGGPTSFIGRTKDVHIGSVDVYVCPDCGLLYSNMRGETKKNGHGF